MKSLDKSAFPIDDDGKQYMRAESRPLEMTTYFTMAGDDIAGNIIGGGTELAWNFSTGVDMIAAPAGYNRKRLEFSFIDVVRVKEGTLYWENALFGSYIDLFVVCPVGQYYLANDGSPRVASVDTPVEHFVNMHHMMGTCYMGDELNTEAASAEIPSSYKFWLDVTVPSIDGNSKGYGSIEVYRNRTVILL